LIALGIELPSAFVDEDLAILGLPGGDVARLTRVDREYRNLRTWPDPTKVRHIQPQFSTALFVVAHRCMHLPTLLTLVLVLLPRLRT
jgi:hypothetical protein